MSYKDNIVEEYGFLVKKWGENPRSKYKREHLAKLRRYMLRAIFK
jgi:hypothetical protein